MEIKSFLATVHAVYPITDDLLPYKKGEESDYIPIYNDNKDYISSMDNVEFLGSIKFRAEVKIIGNNIAFPFDKNNITLLDLNFTAPKYSILFKDSI